MTKCYCIGNQWKENNAEIMCDLATEEGIKKYVKLCAEAKAIPPLSDQDFYKNMIEKNAEVFANESKKKRLARQKLKKQKLDQLKADST
jgi:hypothetical protein